MAHRPGTYLRPQSARVSGPLLSPKRTAREAGEDPRVILMRVLWCGPMDTQIREVRGQSALGGMISGSV